MTSNCIVIKQAVREDLQEILDLQYFAFQSEAQLLDNYDIQPLKQTLAEMEQEFADGVFLKAVDDNNNIIGSVRGKISANTLYIGKLIVSPELQRRGIGRRLLAELENFCPHKRCELFTSSKSERNIRLYKSAGYKIFEKENIASDLQFVYMEK